MFEHEPVLAKCGLAKPATRLGVFEESRRGFGNRDRSSLRFFGQRVPRPPRLRLDSQLLRTLPVRCVMALAEKAIATFALNVDRT